MITMIIIRAIMKVAIIIIIIITSFKIIKDWVKPTKTTLLGIKGTVTQIIIQLQLISSNYYMAVSHKDWELPNSWIWLAEMDIDRGLDFPM